jgi:hypothetical protein
MNTSDWNIIDVYSRKQAIADGIQVLASPETTKEAGIKFPVFFTTTAHDRYVKVPSGAESLQHEDARLWDIFTMFKYFARITPNVTDFFELKVSVYFPDGILYQKNERRDINSNQREVTLHAVIGAMDFDDPSPAITIMIPGED